MSKLDRFLIYESLMISCPNISATTLDRYLSDHRPIFCESKHDYGPVPFRFFQYWLEVDGFEKLVNETWSEAPVDMSNAMLNLMKKLNLIGSLYKIIAKILANRLVVVLGDIVNEVQSAFVADRQILDSPFILNELFQWCKSKKKHSFIFKMKTLSIGGRLTLLKSVLGSIPIYHMSIFKVPMKVLHRMESIRSHFFNGTYLGSKKSIWVKWNNVLASKEKGGLGVSSLYALNRALMFKWIWLFTTHKSSLWTRVIKAIHGDDGKFGRNSKSGHTSIWRDIVQEMEVFKKQGTDICTFMHKKLGNGANTSFWEDVRLGNVVFKYRFPRLYALESHKRIDVAAKLAHSSMAYSFQRAPRSDEEQSQLADLWTTIEGVSLVSMNDRWVWSLEVPNKVNVNAWKVRLDSLPTRLNISRRCMDIASIFCPICGNAVESSRHLLFDCHVAKDLFRKISRWWDLSYMEVSSYDEWLAWILNLSLSVKHKRLLEGVCYGMWWHI
nr:RNA-directed DNA polymerase, eukaryota, reverse transcriptase zinc-binding domain protein [Tanacetum cinerariifolium]